MVVTATRYTNSREATQAYAQQSRHLGRIFSEADDGSGGLDVMRVDSSILSGDETARNEELARLVNEWQETEREQVRLTGLEQTRSSVLTAVDSTTRPTGRPGHPTGRPEQRLTAGQQFVSSAGWQDYLAAIRVGDHVPEKSRVQSPPVIVNELIVLGDPTSGGAFTTPQQTGIIVPLPMRELTLLDLVTGGQTDSEVVEYVRVVSLTNNAAGVAESTETADPGTMNAASGVKPESGMTFERQQANVQNIAHWIPATKRSLSDVKQLRTMIDTFLRGGLREELERQAALGTGTGEEIEGFDPVITAAGSIQPYSATVADLDPVFETTRKALTRVQLARGVNPQAFVFHPTDWEDIDLARMVKNPQNEAAAGSNRVLHGIRVVLSEIVPVGTAYVGDFRWYVIWDREQTSISVSDSHANFFIRNLVAILAEMRAAGGLLRTDAIWKIDLTA